MCASKVTRLSPATPTQSWPMMPAGTSTRSSPAKGSNINYLNNEAVYTPMPLHAYDVVDLGESSFLFIPLCEERFRWDGAVPGVSYGHLRLDERKAGKSAPT